MVVETLAKKIKIDDSKPDGFLFFLSSVAMSERSNDRAKEATETHSPQREPRSSDTESSGSDYSDPTPRSRRRKRAISEDSDSEPEMQYSQNDDSWTQYFQQVKERVDECRAEEARNSSSGKITRNRSGFPRFVDKPELIDWLNHQIKQRRNGELTKQQLNLLTSIGFDFVQQRRMRDNQWDRQYEKLRQLKMRNGTADIPKDYNDSGLRKWVIQQRRNYRCGVLAKSRIALLNDIAFCWDPPSKVGLRPPAAATHPELPSQIHPVITLPPLTHTPAAEVKPKAPMSIHNLLNPAEDEKSIYSWASSFQRQ